MIWLTWRLQRSELGLLGLILAGLVSTLALSHSDVVELAGLSECIPGGERVQGTPSTGEGCRFSPGPIYELVNTGLPWFNFLPLIAAVLLVLPIIGELEAGTYRLAWTQGITRQRWTGVKLGLPLACGIAFAGLLAVTFDWWSSPGDNRFSRFGSDTYSFRGTLPVAHTIFALALVLLLGTMLRRQIVAIVLALGAFVGLRLPFEIWIRHRLVSPRTMVSPERSDPQPQGIWELSTFWKDSAGKRYSEDQFFQICPPPTSFIEGYPESCVANLGLTQYMEYHPASHYWPLQLIESGIYLGAALVLIGISAWYLLRRVE